MGAAHNNMDGMAVSRPLLLLTRPEPASEDFWRSLPVSVRSQVELLINPLLSIHVTGPLPSLDGVSGLIFTSSNGLNAYKDLGGPIAGLPVIAVGEGTAATAKALGFHVTMAGGTANRLVQHILDQNLPGPFVHMRGEVAIGDVAEQLTASGMPTTEAILYEQRLEGFSSATREALSQDRVVIAPVFSARTARQLSSESEGLGKIVFAAISPAVAQDLPQSRALQTIVAKTPNRAGMVELVAKLIADTVTLERPPREM